MLPQVCIEHVSNLGAVHLNIPPFRIISQEVHNDLQKETDRVARVKEDSSKHEDLSSQMERFLKVICEIYYAIHMMVVRQLRLSRWLQYI